MRREVITYKSNAALQFVKPNCKGNKLINGKYVCEPPRKAPQLRDIAAWFMKGNPQRREKRNDGYRVPLVNNPNLFATTNNAIAWLGHAAFFIKINGLSLLTDPCLHNIFTLKRQVGIPCAIDEITNIDYLLLSHGHRDHFDVPSLRGILKHNKQATFLAPLDMDRLIVKQLKHERYQTAAWYQQYVLENTDVKITFVPARHWNKRGLRDFNDMLWGGFIIQNKDTTIFFVGDTAYGAHFAEIKAIFGKIDICIMPIGAYKPRTIMASSHVNPAEAVMAANILEATTFIPMHYGTYDLSDEPISEPITQLRLMAQTGQLKAQLQELAVGALLTY